MCVMLSETDAPGPAQCISHPVSTWHGASVGPRFESDEQSDERREANGDEDTVLL